MLIFLLLLLFWFLLSGVINLEYLLVGILISGILTLFYFRMVSGDREVGIRINPLRIWLAIKILFVLLLAIIKANFILAIHLWRARLNLGSVLFRLELPLKTPSAINFAANAITLTPGTISASLREGKLIIHTLYPDQETELKNWKLFKLLREWEGAGTDVLNRS